MEHVDRRWGGLGCIAPANSRCCTCCFPGATRVVRHCPGGRAFPADHKRRYPDQKRRYPGSEAIPANTYCCTGSGLPRQNHSSSSYSVASAAEARRGGLERTNTDYNLSPGSCVAMCRHTPANEKLSPSSVKNMRMSVFALWHRRKCMQNVHLGQFVLANMIFMRNPSRAYRCVCWNSSTLYPNFSTSTKCHSSMAKCQYLNYCYNAEEQKNREPRGNME